MPYARRSGSRRYDLKNPDRAGDYSGMSRVSQTIAVPLGDGRRINVERWDGAGAPLVLLHGMLDSSQGWKGLAQATHRPCYAVDLPGFGASDRPSQARLSAYADDVVEAVAALGVHDFTLVGHSFGGGVAAAMSERIPEEVATLVLMAPVGFGRVVTSELGQLPGIRTLLRHGLPIALANPLTAAGVYTTMVANGHLPERELLAHLRRNAFSCAQGAAMAIEAIAESGRSRHAFHRRLVGYHGPVLALWGDGDRLVPHSHIEGVRSAFPEAEVVVWEHMGHHPQRERPVDLARFVEAACGRARRERTHRRARARGATLSMRRARVSDAAPVPTLRAA